MKIVQDTTCNINLMRAVSWVQGKEDVETAQAPFKAADTEITLEFI